MKLAFFSSVALSTPSVRHIVCHLKGKVELFLLIHLLCFKLHNHRDSITACFFFFLRITTHWFAHSHGTKIQFSALLQTVRDFWKPLRSCFSDPFQWNGNNIISLYERVFLRLKSLKQQVVDGLQERGPINKMARLLHNCRYAILSWYFWCAR